MIVADAPPNKVDPRVPLVPGALLAAWANWQLGGLTQTPAAGIR